LFLFSLILFLYSCPFLGDRFNITIVTRYLPDGGFLENPLKLSEEQLKERTVEMLDIAYDEIDPSKYKEEEDPTIYVSTKTGMTKQSQSWQLTMVVQAEANYKKNGTRLIHPS
jgi:hypothetical protein